ncbi:MAG TPA: hypothetical protein V6D25_19635 [Leptolyngbyaceae cyanobacterium]
MNRYVINILACQDLNEIANYFEQNSLKTGDLHKLQNREHYCQYNSYLRILILLLLIV